MALAFAVIAFYWLRLSCLLGVLPNFGMHFCWIADFMVRVVHVHGVDGQGNDAKRKPDTDNNATDLVRENCSIRYESQRRADIQGLRAISIIAVIAYHLGLPGMAGGFVGVDVFFVISGFVITTKLLTELDRTSHINLVRFWLQRIKRLLPNALLVLTFTLVAAFVLLPAYRLPAIGMDIASAGAFFSNIRFARLAVDYFHHADPQSPILHYWSLSMEEQFYILLPLFLFLASIAHRRLHFSLVVAGLSVAAVLSFYAQLRAIDVSQPAAFFYLQNRAWQFVIGGLLAVAAPFFGRIPHPLRTLGAYLGVGAISYALIAFSDALSYPGYHALIPTVGAGLVLLLPQVGSISRLSRVLTSRPAVWVGDRSYSLYLWHLPLLTIAEQRFGGPLALFVALAFAMLFAVVSFKYVEAPIHHSTTIWRKIPGRLAFMILPVGVVLSGLAISIMPPPGGTSDRTAEIEKASNDFARIYSDGCHLNYDQTVQPQCRYAKRNAAHRLVLFGDSHAAQWFGALDDAASRAGWELHSWTKTNCPAASVPIWYAPRKVYYKECDVWREDILGRLEASPPDIVVIGESSRYFEEIMSTDVMRPLGQEAAEQAVARGLAKTVDRLISAGIWVVLLRDTPIMFPSYKQCLTWQDTCEQPRSKALEGMRSVQTVKAKYPDVSVLDLTDFICDPDTCPANRNGMVIYRNRSHIAETFAKTLAPQFLNLMSGAKFK